MLYREIISVLRSTQNTQIQLCGQNVELLNVKPGGTYSDHGDLNADSDLILPCYLPVDVACIPQLMATRSSPVLMWPAHQTHARFDLKCLIKSVTQQADAY